MLSKLVWAQSAPQVDMEPFEGNPLDFTYFMSMFQESVEKKIDDPRGRLTRLIKYTRGEPQELVKHFIHDRADCGYKNASLQEMHSFKSSMEIHIPCCHHTGRRSNRYNLWNLEMQQHFGNCSISDFRRWELVVNIISWIYLICYDTMILWYCDTMIRMILAKPPLHL